MKKLLYIPFFCAMLLTSGCYHKCDNIAAEKYIRANFEVDDLMLYRSSDDIWLVRYIDGDIGFINLQGDSVNEKDGSKISVERKLTLFRKGSAINVTAPWSTTAEQTVQQKLINAYVISRDSKVYLGMFADGSVWYLDFASSKGETITKISCYLPAVPTTFIIKNTHSNIVKHTSDIVKPIEKNTAPEDVKDSSWLTGDITPCEYRSQHKFYKTLDEFFQESI